MKRTTWKWLKWQYWLALALLIQRTWLISEWTVFRQARFLPRSVTLEPYLRTNQITKYGNASGRWLEKKNMPYKTICIKLKRRYDVENGGNHEIVNNISISSDSIKPISRSKNWWLFNNFRIIIFICFSYSFICFYYQSNYCYVEGIVLQDARLVVRFISSRELTKWSEELHC